MATEASLRPNETGARAHNLPLPAAALVGRGRELERITGTLGKARLVTITGPGGVGKTRLALEIAHRHAARRPDGAWLVDLTAGPERPDVAAETARALGVRAAVGTADTDALRAYLSERDLMLVLDNCEHVIEQSAALGAELLGSCANVRIVATSREPLAIAGETTWTLDPLEPDSAYRLFVERARQRRPDFFPDEADEATIARLCERLDRLPLAIELAAARIGVASPAEILASLETRLGEFGGGGRFAAPRHRTVRASVEWSYQLLSSEEQEAVRPLAVFVGGFDAAAAVAVVPGLGFDELARLVDKSLVAATRSPRGDTRYRLLESVRELAHELLVETGGLNAAKERHLRHFSSLCADVREGWPAADADTFVSAVGDDYENVRAAIEWAVAANPAAAMALVAKAKDLFFTLGQADGVRLAALVLERRPDRDRMRVEVLITNGLLFMTQANRPAAMAALAEARDLAAELGERSLEGWAMFFQGLTATLAGTIEGRRDLEASRAIHREVGSRSGEARAAAALGLSYAIEGQPARAIELIEEGLAINVAEGDGFGEGQCRTYLGMITESSSSDPGLATQQYRRAVECLRPYGDAALLPMALVGQASVIAHRDPALALKVVSAASAVRARVGGSFAPVFQERADRVRRAAEAALGDQAPRIWADGARLAVDEAIGLAFGTSRARTEMPAGLSRREAEVARLVASGLSNKAIASSLQLSVRTVEDHVRHALAKTGLENRTQLATWAGERIP